MFSLGFNSSFGLQKLLLINGKYRNSAREKKTTNFYEADNILIDYTGVILRSISLCTKDNGGKFLTS